LTRPVGATVFIYLCVDSTIDESSLSMIGDSVKTKNGFYFHNLFLLYQALSPQSNLDGQMLSLTRALPIFNGRTILENIHLSIDNIAKCLWGVMNAAQEELCAQLEKGIGEYIAY
jgi:hypothetical protein